MTRQRPTLAGPIVLLPLAAEGLTAVFGMGTGGTPRLWSPGSGIPRLRDKWQKVQGLEGGEINARNTEAA
jgi:hypothetical protein